MLAVLQGSHADAGAVMECQCALIETMYDYCPREGRTWWPSTAKHVASHSEKHVASQGRVFSEGHLRQRRAARVGQPLVLHQHMGYDLAH